MGLCCGALLSSVYAQEETDARQRVFDAFRKEAGDCALLYNGKIADEYIAQHYDNHPYWESAEFHPGAIFFNGHLYKDQQLRYDAYTHELTVITPESNVAIYVDMDKVDYFVRRGVKFVRRDNKFVALLHESPQLVLQQQVVCSPAPAVVKDYVSYKRFERSVRYFLCLTNGETYQVSNRSSVLKLFPEYKKELKKYASDHRLNFRHARAEALTMLIAEADRLTSKK